LRGPVVCSRQIQLRWCSCSSNLVQPTMLRVSVLAAAGVGGS
jgi:hypothetical protein